MRWNRRCGARGPAYAGSQCSRREIATAWNRYSVETSSGHAGASVATIMPGPKTTSIQALYRGEASLDFNSAWLDIASLSNNQYETEHEISAFGAVPAGEIEGILVVRKPAAVP